MEIFFEKQFVFGLVAILFFFIFVLVKSWRHKTGANESSRTHFRFLTYELLWNLIFCPRKTLNYKEFMDVYFLQMLDGVCLTNSKEKAIKISVGGSNYFLLYHPDTIAEVLKSYNTIHKHSVYHKFRCIVGTGLITSSYNKWKIRRKMLSPAFHFRILEDFQEIFYRRSETLVQKLKDKNESEVFDIIPLISRCTLDIIAESAMGVHINSQDNSNNEYVHAIERLTTCFADFFMKPWFWFRPFSYFNPSIEVNRKCKRIVHQLHVKVIKKRTELVKSNQCMDDFQGEEEISGIKKKRTFLDLLLFHHLTDGSLSEKDVKEEVDTFMIAGFHTVTMGIGWTLYLLGLHQDIQEKVFDELKEIFADDGDRTINAEDLRKMKYLECVLKESNRIYPPVPLIIRRGSETKVGDFKLPPNSSLMICIRALHHNPAVYENPEIFDPDRFLPENYEKRHPFAFIPFSAGPRNCIGQKFAMIEMKTVLATVIRNFRVCSLDPRDRVFESLDIVLRPKYGVRITVQRR